MNIKTISNPLITPDPKIDNKTASMIHIHYPTRDPLEDYKPVDRESLNPNFNN